MNKGQQAMAVAKLYPEPAKGGREKNSFLKKEFSTESLSKARTVLRYLPQMAEAVMRSYSHRVSFHSMFSIFGCDSFFFELITTDQVT